MPRKGKIIAIGYDVSANNFWYGIREKNGLIAWLPAAETKILDSQVLDQMPTFEADDAAWQAWAEAFAAKYSKLPESLFEPAGLEEFFYAESITPEQKAALQNMYTRGMVFTILYQRKKYLETRQGKTVDADEFSIQYGITSMSTMNLFGKAYADIVHDCMAHMIMACAQHGPQALEQGPTFMRDFDDIPSTIPEEAATLVIDVKPSAFWPKPEQFLEAHGAANLSPERFAAFFIHAGMRIQVDHEGRYLYAGSNTQEEVDAAFDRLEANPPPWLVHLLWTFFDRHPRSHFNELRRQRGEPIPTLDPNILLKLLYDLIPAICKPEAIAAPTDSAAA